MHGLEGVLDKNMDCGVIIIGLCTNNSFSLDFNFYVSNEHYSISVQQRSV